MVPLTNINTNNNNLNQENFLSAFQPFNSNINNNNFTIIKNSDINNFDLKNMTQQNDTTNLITKSKKKIIFFL